MNDPRPDPFLQRTPIIGPGLHRPDPDLPGPTVENLTSENAKLREKCAHYERELKRGKMHGEVIQPGEEPAALLRIMLADAKAEIAALREATAARPSDSRLREAAPLSGDEIALPCLACGKKHLFPLASNEACGVFNVFCDGDCEDRYAARL